MESLKVILTRGDRKTLGLALPWCVPSLYWGLSFLICQAKGLPWRMPRVPSGSALFCAYESAFQTGSFCVGYRNLGNPLVIPYPGLPGGGSRPPSTPQVHIRNLAAKGQPRRTVSLLHHKVDTALLSTMVRGNKYRWVQGGFWGLAWHRDCLVSAHIPGGPWVSGKTLDQRPSRPLPLPEAWLSGLTAGSQLSNGLPCPSDSCADPRSFGLPHEGEGRGIVKENRLKNDSPLW